jgi:hypothetical protein
VQVAAIEAMLPKWLEQSRTLSDALSSVGNWHFDSGQMASFVQSTMSQIEVAANFTLPELKATADAITDGHHPIPRETAESRPVKVTEAAPKSDPVLVEANFQPIDRGPARKLGIAP